MNYVDAERITKTLTASSGKKVNNASEADLIVVLSCGVRQGAEERIIHWIQKTKKEHKKAKIILTGCLSHRKAIKTRLKKVLYCSLPIDKWTTAFSACNKDFYEIIPDHSSNYRAYIPIMNGCNNFCAYCVVPFARGREISRMPESILEEIKVALKRGVKEIYLLGQNVASFKKKDRKGKTWTFPRLLTKIDNLPGKFWIRFVSTHPKDVNAQFIKAFGEGKKISSNLHLPVQAGSNRILGKMNRKYSREKYLANVKAVRKARPKTVFSSDIIVGFPGETARDFQDSVDIVKKSQFEMLYSLKYYPRPGTAAYAWKDNVPAATKKFRQQALDKTWEKIALKKNQQFLGKKIVILIDKIKLKEGQGGERQYHALGKNFENKDVSAIITSSKKHGIVGKWGIVKINKVGSLGMSGELVKVKKDL